MIYREVCIIGTGLIGGSMGLLIKEIMSEIRLTGVDLPDVIDNLPDNSPFDRTATRENLAEVLSSADLILLALPVAAVIDILPEVISLAKDRSVISDVGSVKRDILSCAETHKTPEVAFIGGHPIGGSERQGFENASSELLSGAKFIICPADDVPSEVLKKHIDFLASLKFEVMEMNAETHDRAMAYTSHLPQLISTALALTAGTVGETNLTAGPGFSSMTRLAVSPPEIWEDIFDHNRDEFKHAVYSFSIILTNLIADVENGTIREKFISAANARSKILGDL